MLITLDAELDGDTEMADYFTRNKAWAKPQTTYQTQLSAENESRFNNWLKANAQRVGEFNPKNPTEDYDMRGWWLQNKGAPAPVGHFEDTFKTPYHETFSNESKYATPNAPAWKQQGKNWYLIDSAGNVLKAE